MKPITILALAAVSLSLGTVAPGSAQTFPTNDRVIRNMWTQGMGPGSQIYRLGQSLLDSIGPRLTGTPGHAAAVEWALERYRVWGIPARKEQYGTWKGWRRGHTRLELLAPRWRGLEATMIGYSPGTGGPVEGDVVIFPALPDGAAYARWFGTVRGRFVLISPPEPTCRPYENLAALARPQTIERLYTARDSVQTSWARRYSAAGPDYMERLEAAGAAGVFRSFWSEGWGVNKIQHSGNATMPEIDVSCEDYGLLARLAENGQGPRARLDADAEFLGDQPAYNVVAELRGRQLPNEYVLLSAHFDSFDSAAGATDNGTGSLIMMEAMRILRATYPNPKRTILLGHWGGEEQGELGSVAFAADHPEILQGLQIGFNQDNGTWRIEAIRMQSFNQAETQVNGWLRRIPREISDTVKFTSRDLEGGSDHEAFTCHGAPVVRLQSNYPDYRQYTWHTNLDSFDKIIFDDLKNNATLVAMLAYLASEDSVRVSRVRDPLPADTQGRAPTRPECSAPRRSFREG